MIRKLIFLFLLLCVGKSALANYAKYNTDSLMSVLDKIISSKMILETNKQLSIERHLYSYRNAADELEEFHECSILFDRYCKYKLDSAFYYAKQKLKLAEHIGNKDSIAYSMMNVADGLKGLGHFKEALDLLHSIPKSDFVSNCQYYYYLLHSVTLSIASGTISPVEKRALNKELRQYRDSIDAVNPKGSLGAIINRAEMLKSDGRFSDAVKMLEDLQSNARSEIYEFAIYWTSLASVYQFIGNVEAAKGCYINAAIIDLKKCVKSYTSLQDLAMLLYSEGDVDHAYKYITRAMEDIIESNSRSRLIQVSEYMPIITSAYSKKQQEIHGRNITFGMILIFLVLLLAAETVALYKRNRHLKHYNFMLDAKNEELVTLNERLTSLNDKINKTNHQLSDANKIKEEYIALLFIICSEYIDDFEHYRISLTHKLKTNQIDEVKKMVNKNLMLASLKEFFKKFDTIFLDLFPNFVEEFNNLLKPEARITLKEGELLTPELRIYALVRLGINESTRIANLLHYSLQTVYNYRMKIRNRALIPKNKFVEAVQNLC